MSYKLNKKWIEMRKHLNKSTIYGEYICQYRREITFKDLDIRDYCIPFTRKELELLREGDWEFSGPDKDGNYMIDGDLLIWIED